MMTMMMVIIDNRSLPLVSSLRAGTRFQHTAALNDVSGKLDKWTKNAKLRSWVLDHVKLMNPSAVHLCDGQLAALSARCCLWLACFAFFCRFVRSRACRRRPMCLLTRVDGALRPCSLCSVSQ